MKRTLLSAILLSASLFTLPTYAVDTERLSPHFITIAEEELRTRAAQELPHLPLPEATNILRARDAFAELEARQVTILTWLNMPRREETLPYTAPYHLMPDLTDAERFVTKLYWATTEAFLAFYNFQNGHPILPASNLQDLDAILQSSHYTLADFLTMDLDLEEMTHDRESPLGRVGNILSAWQLNVIITPDMLHLLQGARQGIELMLNPFTAYDFLRKGMSKASFEKDWPTLRHRIRAIQNWWAHQESAPFHPHNTIFFRSEWAFYTAQAFIEMSPPSLLDHPHAEALYRQGALLLRHVTTALTGLEHIIDRQDPEHPLVFNVPLQESLVPQTQQYLGRAQDYLQSFLQSALPQTPAPQPALTLPSPVFETPAPEEITTPDTDGESSPIRPSSNTSSPNTPASVLHVRSPHSSAHKRTAEESEMTDGEAPRTPETATSDEGSPPPRRRRRLDFHTEQTS